MEGKMKQAWLMGKGGPWEIKEVPIPKPGVDEVLIKMKTSSICNQTDLKTIQGLHPAHEDQYTGKVPHHLRMWYKQSPDELADVYPKRGYTKEPFPTKMGHEGAGTVVEVGPTAHTLTGHTVEDYTHFKPGDRVSFVAGRSSFGEYTISNINSTVKVPDSLDDEEASLFEPIISVYSGMYQVLRLGDTVCILGQGALGLVATQLAKAMGAKRIIVSDPIKMKRDLAKKFGADETIDPSTKNVVHEIEDLTDGKGVEVVVECVGIPATIRTLPYIVAFGGKIVQIGTCCVPVLVDWSYIHFRGLKVVSCPYTVTDGSFGTLYDRCFEIMASRMDIKPLITHRYYALEDINKAFKDVATGMVIKGMFIFK